MAKFSLPSLAIDAAQHTPPDQWRTQAAANRQGSGGALAADALLIG
jgi:thymidylate synthase (FAD)